MPDPVVQHPGLAGDGLDHVVAVEALQRLEVVIRAARAAGAAHVDVDDREPEQVGDRAIRSAARPDRRSRSRSTRPASGTGPEPAGQAHVDRQPGAVARASGSRSRWSGCAGVELVLRRRARSVNTVSAADRRSRRGP